MALRLFAYAQIIIKPKAVRIRRAKESQVLRVSRCVRNKRIMDYIYIVIFRFEGIAATNIENDKLVYQDDSQGIAVTLTKNVNRHSLVLDRGQACATLLLCGNLFDENAQELIDIEVKKLQEGRISKKSSGVYAVITIKGQAELDIKDNYHRETEHFHVCFDAVDKESLEKKHEQTIHSLILSLPISTGAEYFAKKIISGIHFTDSSNKPLYSFTERFPENRMIDAKSVKPKDKYLNTQINWKGIGDYLSAARTISEHGTSNTTSPRIHCQGLALELAFKFYLWDKNGKYLGIHDLEKLAFTECQDIDFSEDEITIIKNINAQYLNDGEFPYPARYRPVVGRLFLSPSQEGVEGVISKIIRATSQSELLDQILTR